MHAYLIIYKQREEFESFVKDSFFEKDKLIKRLSLRKVEEVRNLVKTSKFISSQNTLFIIDDLEEASIEAKNSFLKFLEEPPEKSEIIISIKNENLIIDTIKSRCKTIYLKSQEKRSHTEFFKKNQLFKDKLNYLKNYSDNDNLLAELAKILDILHKNLVSGRYKNKKSLLAAISHTQELIINIKLNGNLNLQLFSYLIKLEHRV